MTARLGSFALDPMKKLFVLFSMFAALAATAQVTNVSLGSGPNTGTGDTLYLAFGKVNTNIAWLWAQETNGTFESHNTNLDGWSSITTNQLVYPTYPGTLTFTNGTNSFYGTHFGTGNFGIANIGGLKLTNATASRAAAFDAAGNLTNATPTLAELNDLSGVGGVISSLYAPLASPTFTGLTTVNAIRLLASGPSPTITTNGTGNSSGIGSGGTATLEPNSDDNIQIVDITIAGSPTINAFVARITYGSVLSMTNRGVWPTDMNSADSALEGPFRQFFYTNFTTAYYELWSGGTALTLGTYRLGLKGEK
jgi:hypothetical protein